MADRIKPRKSHARQGSQVAEGRLEHCHRRWFDHWQQTKRLSQNSLFSNLSGEYVRRWVPELRGLGDASIHAPWELGAPDLAAAGVHLGQTYPAPTVDHGRARERALAPYGAAKAAAGS